MDVEVEAASALHRRFRERGVELIESRGAAAPRAFGPEAVTDEHRALVESAGLVDTSGRVLVRVEGKRAQEMVSGLVTNHVMGLGPGQAIYAFLLTPKGRPVAELRVLVRDETHLLLDTPAACRDGLLAHLKKYLPPIYAAFEVEEDLSRLSVIGPRSAGALPSRWRPEDGSATERLDPLQFAGIPLRDAAPEGGDAGEPGEGLLLRREAVEGPGFDLYAPTDLLLEVWDELEEGVGGVGGRAVGREAHEIWRVERGIPVYGPEINTDGLPQETGQQERAIDFESGCYTGQEVVARIHYRGHVNRRLMGLRLPDAGLPPTGHELYAGDRARGTITSPVLSPRFGPIALGYVRRELEAEETLALEEGGEARVRITELPFSDRAGEAGETG